jgi:hypothetical protein
MTSICIFDDYEDGPDDDRWTAETWKRDIERVLPPGEYSVDLIGSDGIEQQMKVLESRRMAARSGRPVAFGTEMIDQADLLIVDYDLLYLKTQRSVSGDDVAYLARCFSGCGLIVGVNRFKRAGGFNLNMCWSPDSYADYDIHGKFLSSPGLWFPDPARWGDFRPWYWPALTCEIETFRERVRCARASLGDGVLDTFGFPQVVRDTLPRALGGFIEGGSRGY